MDRILKKISTKGLLKDLLASRTPVIGPSAIPVIGKQIEMLTIGPPRHAWADLGWERDGDRLVGSFRASSGQKFHLFKGLMEIKSQEIVAFVLDPPPGLSKHNKGSCFKPDRGSPWFRVHWWRRPHRAEDAIFYIEQVLSESL